MIFGLLYLLSFAVGVFVVWKLGRDEYYDEEKLIDLSVFTTLAALVSARLAFFLGSGRDNELIVIREMPNIWLSLIRFFQLSHGSVWWVGVIVFIVVGLFMLWRWQWPYWPSIGILVLGGAVGLAIKEILLWYWQGLSLSGLVLANELFIIAILIYLLQADVVSFIGDFTRGVRYGWQSKSLENRQSEEVKHQEM